MEKQTNIVKLPHFLNLGLNKIDSKKPIQSKKEYEVSLDTIAYLYQLIDTEEKRILEYFDECG